ncbi:uncharacterized protein ARMOST_10286 [Armillaria ostoyae]|uniref:Uncharacterized protein n=1 Tax=Armillaria ostoyae TaxID=47428 RepID=A0A284RDV7_ARMOS|nr:uncharacterized protein ARMOST_10286 [Armillaria ostoyae]
MDFLHHDLHTSPFKPLVSTNDPPSELEAKTVEEFLDDHLRELSKQDEEIARVSTLLHRLTNERLNLQQYITAHQAIVSSIRRFPTEILAEIFIQSLEDHYDVFDTKRGPWGLCHVCRRWRDVSRSSPALWASLSIESLHLQPQFRHADLPTILEDVLALTSNRKLNIRYSLKSVIICDRSLPDSYLPKTIWSNRGSNSWDILQLLFEILVRHSTRWKTAWLVIPFKLGSTLQTARGRLTSLVSIDFSPCNPLHYWSMCFNPESIDVLSTAPKLQSLTITPAPNTVALPHMPCSRLRYFAHTLYASVEDLSLLEHLTCPALEELSLDLCHFGDLEHILFDFDNRSGYPLRQLSIGLEYLGDVGGRFLNRLTPEEAEHNHALLSGLETFRIAIGDGQKETPKILNSLIHIIKARWGTGTSVGLRPLSMVIEKDNWSEFEVEDKLNFLRQFKEEGFNVSVKRNGKQEV